MTLLHAVCPDAGRGCNFGTLVYRPYCGAEAEKSQFTYTTPNPANASTMRPVCQGCENTRAMYNRTAALHSPSRAGT